ncbi:MAG: hypothetical protein V7K71_29915 [Nostoc sp.]|uniref:hypothetical protein n=1 Tax=Nostoc sp. TaxID=1180 RepID=UPI002FFB3784
MVRLGVKGLKGAAKRFFAGLQIFISEAHERSLLIQRGNSKRHQTARRRHRSHLGQN